MRGVRLSEMQERFVAAFVGDARGNATEAARRAGYTHPNGQASRLLVTVGITRAIDAARAAIRNEGIANLQNRMDAYNDRWQRLQRVLAERGADPAMAEVPGGTTGLLVRQWKIIGVGRDAQMVEEHMVDVGLLRELRELEKQAAIERGQWQEKRTDDASTTVNVNVQATVQTAAVTYDSFSRAFARITGVGDSDGDGAEQPLDSAGADRAAGRLPLPPGA